MDSWSLEETMGVVKQALLRRLIRAVRPPGLACILFGKQLSFYRVCGNSLSDAQRSWKDQYTLIAAGNKVYLFKDVENLINV